MTSVASMSYAASSTAIESVVGHVPHPSVPQVPVQLLAPPDPVLDDDALEVLDGPDAPERFTHVFVAGSQA